MAHTVEDAVAERLMVDPELVTLLAQFDSTPAIFPDVHVPAGVDFPLVCVIVRSGPSDGSKTQTGYDWRLLIRCFGGFTQRETLAAIAERVRVLMHHNPIDVGDWEGWLSVADAPSPVPVLNALCQEVPVRVRAMA